MSTGLILPLLQAEFWKPRNQASKSGYGQLQELLTTLIMERMTSTFCPNILPRVDAVFIIPLGSAYIFPGIIWISRNCTMHFHVHIHLQADQCYCLSSVAQEPVISLILTRSWYLAFAFPWVTTVPCTLPFITCLSCLSTSTSIAWFELCTTDKRDCSSWPPERIMTKLLSRE